MKKLDTILVASDLSDKAEMALLRAALLARQTGAKLELLHVLEDLGPEVQNTLHLETPTERLRRQLIEQAREELRRQARLVFGEEFRPTLTIETGKDFVAIIHRARKIDADLIVVSAHGGHFVRDLFLGTTAEKVVRKGDRPVLVVKKSAERPYEQVLAPTDFSEASRQAIRTALLLAPEAAISLLHVYRLWGAGRLTPDGMSDEGVQRNLSRLLETTNLKMRDFLRNLDPGSRKVNQHLRLGHPPALLPFVASELGADLVAMGTEGLSGLPYMLLGSVTEHVLRHAECDVLAVRPPTFCFRLP